MITIDQLLESVDLDFEPRWVTKDGDGSIYVWAEKPVQDLEYCDWGNGGCNKAYGLKLSEFDGKDWAECIYEVPRKTSGKIEKLKYATVSKCGESDKLIGTKELWQALIQARQDLETTTNALEKARINLAAIEPYLGDEYILDCKTDGLKEIDEALEHIEHKE